MPAIPPSGDRSVAQASDLPDEELLKALIDASGSRLDELSREALWRMEGEPRPSDVMIPRENRTALDRAHHALERVRQETESTSQIIEKTVENVEKERREKPDVPRRGSTLARRAAAEVEALRAKVTDAEAALLEQVEEHGEEERP